MTISLFPMAERTILSLCDHSGAWSKPYQDSGYRVIQVDISAGMDVRLIPFPGKVHGILAAPPCDRFCNPSARFWKAADTLAKASAPEVGGHVGRWQTSQTLHSLSIADACLRLAALCNPDWWVLENSIGRLPRWYGEPRLIIQPFHYAGLADDPSSENYSKRTCLWGRFNNPGLSEVPQEPMPEHLPPGRRDRTSRMSSNAKRLRAQTPTGFSRAFFKANP